MSLQSLSSYGVCDPFNTSIDGLFSFQALMCDREVLLYAPDGSNVKPIRNHYSHLVVYPPRLQEIKKEIEKISQDENQRKSIVEDEVNGKIASPSIQEQEQLDLLNTFKEKGFEIPVFFQMWRKIILQESITEVDVEKIRRLPKKDQDLLYSILFRYNRYKDIHQFPQFPVEHTAYDVNLFWLEKKVHPKGQKYLGSTHTLNESEQRKQFKDRFVSVVKAWSEGNDCDINIWYHSALTDPKIIRASRKVLEDSLPEKSHLVQFRDVSEIDLSPIRVNSQFFTHEDIYHYLKIDALKALIMDHTLRKRREVKYGVCVDLDVKALSKEELFDQQTINALDQSGFIMGLSDVGGPTNGYENSFMIFDRDKTDVLDYHQLLLRSAVQTRLQDLNSYLMKGTTPDKATKKSIIQGIYTMYLQLANRELLEAAAKSHEASGEDRNAWKAKSQKLEKEARLPPVKPITSPPTKYDWN